MNTAVRSRSIFGREPAQWVGLIQAVLAFLVMFPGATEWGFTQEWSILFLAFVGAVGGAYIAWATRDTGLGAVLALVKTGVPLAAYYGFSLTADQTGALLTAVPILVAFYQRTQTSPVDAPVDPSPQQVTQSPVGQLSTIPGTNLDTVAPAPAVDTPYYPVP